MGKLCVGREPYLGGSVMDEEIESGNHNFCTDQHLKDTDRELVNDDFQKLVELFSINGIIYGDSICTLAESNRSPKEHRT